jgi:TonB-linked SusC/RagA family outer membrane protein
MKKLLNYVGLLILMLFANVGQLSAQESVIVNGQIIDAQTKEPIPGVNVVEMNEMDRFLSGTITDFNGNFAIKIENANIRIQFSYIGYGKVTREIGQTRNFKIELTSNAQSIDEVSITASKISNDGIQSIRDRATAVSRIELDQLATVMTSSVEEMLQGRLAGVDISSISGDPGAGLNIRIRGTATLNGENDPLIVVNGIPYSSDIDDDFDFSSADAEKFGSLIDVSPEDIESIEVLKDAASTAIWGSKAANGVLMIKTKRGLKSEPLFDYTYKYTIGWEPPALPMLDGGDYASLIQQEHYNYDKGNFYEDEFDVTDPDNLAAEIFYDPDWANYKYFSQETDWVDAITKTSYSQQHTFSVRGGGDKARYKMSVGYSDEDGTTINNGLKKLTSGISLDYDLSTKLRVLTDVMYTRYDQHNTYDSESDEVYGLRTVAYRKMPNQSIYEIDDDGNFITDEFYTPQETLQGDVQEEYNPVALATLGVNEQLKNNVRASFTSKFQALKHLSWDATITMDLFDNKRHRFLPYEAIGGDYDDDLTNLASDEYTKKTCIYTFNKLIFTPTFDDPSHSLTVLGQLDTEKTATRGEFQETNKSSSADFVYPVGDNNITSMSESYSEFRSVGLFAMGYYKYKDKYLFTAGAKYEGNSKYSSESRWGFFPTLSGAWRISSEPFMQSATWIDDFKLRLSWGESGNSPSSNYLYWNTYASSSSYSYMGVQGVEPESMEFTDLQWEVIEQINPGLSFNGLKNKLNVEVDYYKKTTHNLYIDGLGVPSSCGFSSIDLNEGSMENRGFEFSADYTVIKKKDFTLSFNMNLTRNTNTVVSLPENYDLELDDDILENGCNYVVSIEPGKALGGFFGYRYLGVYDSEDDLAVTDENGDPVYGLNSSTPLTMTFNGGDYDFKAGDAKYEDVNNDGTIDELDVVYLGDLNPKLMGGLGCRVYYKGFTLNSLFYFKVGQKVINETRVDTESMDDYDNQSTATNSYWRSTGDNTDIPRPVYYDEDEDEYARNYLASSRFVEDGDYIRLKSVSLKYNFSKNLLAKTGIKLRDVNCYLTGYNLLTFTNYSGQDPDVSIPSDPSTLPTDDSKTPPSRRVIIGFNVKF